MLKDGINVEFQLLSAFYMRMSTEDSNDVELQMFIMFCTHCVLKIAVHCKYQRYILTRCSVNLLVVFNTMVLKRVFFVIINTCVALI